MSTKSAILSTLETSIWFKNWPRARIDKLAQYSRLQHHEKNQLVYSDDEPSHLVYLARGTAWTSLLQNDPRVKFGILFPGALMGISRMLHPGLKDSAFQYEAAQDCLVMQIPVSAFSETVQTHPDLWRLVAESAVLYHRQCVKLALGLHTGAIRNRVIFAIHHYCLQNEPARLKVLAMKLDLSQWDLASLIQSTRPYVNRALKQLEQEGLVTVGYKKIEIIDFQRFRDIAESLAATPA